VSYTRRWFLRSSGLALASCGLAPHALARPVVAGGKVLVLVFLRGGMDGLSLVVPHGEPDYYRLRSSIAVPRPGADDGALDLDGHFGLHPSAASLMPLFRAGLGVAVHAVGHAGNTRSHFEEQDVWETGVAENTLSSHGWLNRHLMTSSGRGPVRAVCFGEALPRVLRGDVPAYAVRSLDQLTDGAERSQTAALAALGRAHAGAQTHELVEEGGRAALDALREMKRVADSDYTSDVVYPDTGLGRRFRDVARTIRADVGLEVAELDFGGWDTHQDQGGPRGGPFTRLSGQLAEAIAAFTSDLDDRLDDVLVLAVSEFGRTVRQNGTNGTDHGWANCTLALGGPIRAAGGDTPRLLVGEWPGLAREQLHDERDLMHTTDFRDLIAEVVGGHLGNERLDEVLAGHTAQRVGLV
jgi:uncharacterized protein (DUF1501 family)